MALSNWDTAAWNEKGESVLGKMTVGKTTVEIYKNWIYIWNDDLKRNKKDLMPIQIDGNSHISTDKVEICTKEVSSGAIFVVAIFSIYGDKKENGIRDCEHKALLGIGGYGYNGDNWIGIRTEWVEMFIRWIERLKIKGYINADIKTPYIEQTIRYNQGDAMLSGALKKGVLPPSSTEIGKSDKSILMQMMEKIE